MHRKSLLIVSALMVLVAAAAPALAGPGIHLGASVDPDDFLFGLRFHSHPIEEYFTIVPNVELGVGDVTMVAGNLDGHYNFKTESKYRPYVGAGFTVNWFDFDGGSDTEVGGSILGGVHLNEKWFFETKVGLGDVPDWKFIVGFEKP